MFICFSFPYLVAQKEAKDILEEFRKKYTQRSDYQAEIIYEVFKGFDSEIAHQKSTGVLLKKGNKMYTNSDEAEIISTSNYYIRVNHKEKAILLTDGINIEKSASQFDLNQLFEFLDIDSLVSNAESWRIILKAKPITQLPFSAIHITIDKETYEIKSQVFYYINKIDFSQDYRKTDISNVKLKITYKNYTVKEFTISDRVFDSKNYLNLKNKKYIPTIRYKGYDIINKLTNK